ncbi:MAG: DUF1330 domain-containing protein [Gammaproteobacteria bacterium]
MPAYFIGRVTVHDEKVYQKYLEGFGPAFTPFGGKVLVATTAAELIEGSWPKCRTVVLEFPSMETAHAWHASPAYQELVKIRHANATSDFVLAPGYGS